MGVDRAQALLRVVTRLPLFAGLGAEEAKAVLQACELRRCPAGDTLCQAGEPSGDMVILLSGQLGVYGPDGVQLAAIDPGASVGEMGLVTGQPRSATVRALRESNLLGIRKIAFDRLLRSDGRICRRVYANVIRTLVERLQESQVKQRQAEEECGRAQAELETALSELGRPQPPR
ncbi:MAG: cyclic nucleotide-binding domain-containing protein [Candidatus Latescibacterota bacterium]